MITGATQIMMHIGDPIAQARAPRLVNPLLSRRGIDGVLIPMHVAPAGLRAALDGLRAAKNCAGAIITMPHKVAAAELADELAAEARLLGACNVIRREPDGRLVGSMLDGEGFVAGLKASGERIAGRSVFMAGAGGVALGIALALAKHGAADLVVHNRTRARAEALRETMRSAFPAFDISVRDQADPRGCDIAINATALGMNSGDGMPMRVESLMPGRLAAEVVIKDAPTAFLAAAADRGCRTQPGLAMLEAQVELLVDFMLGAGRDAQSRSGGG